MRQQNAQPVRSSMANRSSHNCTMFGHEAADGLFQIAVVALRVLQHQPEASDTLSASHCRCRSTAGRSRRRNSGFSSGQETASFAPIGVQLAPVSSTK
jgi:hypothetical protein